MKPFNFDLYFYIIYKFYNMSIPWWKISRFLWKVNCNNPEQACTAISIYIEIYGARHIPPILGHFSDRIWIAKLL